MTIASVPSSEPSRSMNSGFGNGTDPARCSAVITAHSSPRSVWAVSRSGGGSPRRISVLGLPSTVSRNRAVSRLNPPSTGW
jgi:hypothetical protein